MKKSFMTRALAMGLSFAMAFSLAAATNVTTAAAAAKPAMKNSKMTVKVGQTKNYNAAAATAKAYKITKTSVSSANKDKATVTVKSNKKGITVTGEKAVSSMNVRVYFKNIKTKKTTSVVSKLTVKAVEEEEVVTKQSIVSAEATGVKTIKLTMAKEVASVASPVAITVKKGASAKDQKASVEGKVITLAMDTKLTQGTYDITIAGLETENLTTTVEVAKDETLTSYEISDVLALESLSDTGNTTKASTNSAICKYKALNQYGEPMTADAPTATCSFGKIRDIKAATASVVGEIEVEDINVVLAIPGTKGTMTLVDSNNGVNTTKEITISSPATPAEVTVVGTYNVTTSKMQEIVANSKIQNYYILLTAKDQYGWDVKEFTDDVSINIAGGVTNVKTFNNGTKPKGDSICTNVIVDGKEYIAIKLGNGSAVAGSYIMTIVNGKKGMLVNGTYTVAEDVIIKSISITADNGIYARQENELNYEVIDTNGNSIKDYATLIANPVDFGNASDYGKVSWRKNSDGTAKLIYDGTGCANVVIGTSDTASITDTVVVSCNDSKTSNYFVKPIALTVRKARYIKSIYGLDSSATTSVTPSQKLEISADKLIYLDQYSNKVTKEADTTLFGTSGCITSGAIDVSTECGLSYYFEDKDGAFGGNRCCTFGAISDGTQGFTFNSTTQKGTATVYLKYGYYNTASGAKDAQASAQSYDAKFTISNVDTTDLETSSIKIKSINKGYDIETTKANALNWNSVSKAAVKVVAVIGGQETEIPDSQWDFVGGDGTSWTTEEINKNVKTKTCKLEVLVTTWTKGGNEVQTKVSKDYNFSWDDKIATTIDSLNGTSNLAVSANTVLAKREFGEFFNIKDQYGNKYNSLRAYLDTPLYNDWPVSFEVTVLNGDPEDDYKIVSNGTSAVKMEFKTAARGRTFKMKITAKSAKDGSSKTAYVTFVVS